GTSGAATGDTSAQTDPFKGITGTTKRGLTIPGNVWELIEEAAGDPSDPDYVPADILAAVIYQADPSWQGLPPETIADVAAQLRDAYNQAIRYTSRAEDAAVREPRREEEARALVGRPIAAAEARLRSSTEGQWWREHGPAVKKARTWLDNMSIDYLGKPFDNQQVAEIDAQGWTPQTYEEHLRAQPYGASTLGQFYQTRRDAEAAAQKWLGKDTDPGVVNWLISHKFTSPDQIDAFYEQMKQRYYALPAHASGEQPTTAPPPAEAKPIESAPGIRALAGGSVEQQARRQTERSAA